MRYLIATLFVCLVGCSSCHNEKINSLEQKVANLSKENKELKEVSNLREEGWIKYNTLLCKLFIHLQLYGAGQYAIIDDMIKAKGENYYIKSIKSFNNDISNKIEEMRTTTECNKYDTKKKALDGLFD